MTRFVGLLARLVALAAILIAVRTMLSPVPQEEPTEMICASIDVIIQAARLRDGSRRITHITEVMGMEGDTIITQDVFLYDMVGEDASGKIIGRHRSTGIGRPRFWDRARYYGEEKRLAAALDAAEVATEV